MITLVLGVVCLLSIDTLAVTIADRSPEAPKAKRYLTHEPTPCPPVPHVHQPMTQQLTPQSWTPPVYKPQVIQPTYHQPMIHQPVQIQPMAKPWYPQKINYHVPQFSYAPSYQVPLKKLDYQHTDYLKPVNYHAVKTPGITYKDGKDCEPCHQSSQHYQPLVQRPYVKPIIHEPPARPTSHYLPAPHMQSSLIKQALYHAPCNK